MEILLFFLICGMSFSQGFKAYTAEEQTNVFNKRKLPIEDVKAYNKFCAKLLYGYGIVAGVTAAFMMVSSGWWSTIFTILIIVEALVLVRIYSKNEIKFLRKN